MKTQRYCSTHLFIAIFLTFLLTGCGSSVMIQAKPETDISKDFALVTFVRPSAFGGAIQFSLWDSENFVGVLSMRSMIQYRATPGEHIFMANSENWSYVKANLEGGKHYFIVASVFPGAWRARVALDAANASDEKYHAQAKKWLEDLTPTAIKPEAKDAYVKPRLNEIRKAIADFKSGNAKYSTLNIGDYYKN